MSGSSRCLLGAVIAIVFALTSASVARAAPPSAGTGAATAISYGSATVNGAVNPHGSATSYYFQYGPTRAFGAQTALAQITTLAVGHAAVKVSAALSGLQPLTTYYYRLIAVNAAGAATGADRTFKTAKVPLSLAILTSPNPVPYGGTTAIQGTVSGTGNSDIGVVLQSNPFPYTQGFLNLGNAELTNTAGGFSFPVALTQATQFRVITLTKSVVVSPVVIEGVAVNVTAHLHRTHRRHHFRIYGTVTPAIDGMEVAIMRVLGGGHQRLVAGTILLRHNATSSRFSRIISVRRRGLYRVFVKVTNGAQTSNYSQPLFIR